MEDSVNFERLVPQAALAFQQATACSAAFTNPVVLKNGRRSLILRCQVEAAESKVSSVIVKQIKEEPVCGFSEWASLAFLSELPEARDIVPCFYGGDISNRLFLIEDLGEGHSLQDLLTGVDRGASYAALKALAAQMGRLQAVTFRQQDRFEAIRAALPHRAKLGCQWEASNWLEQRSKREDWFQALGVVKPFGFDLGLKQISDIYRQPDEFLTFTQGDPAPSNNHFTKNRACLLDFEYGAFRHALYDITGWNILCPLPADCVREMSCCFRAELMKGCPAARDEARFTKEWAYLCAYRALAMLTWMPSDIIGENRLWVGKWTMREAVLVAISRLKQVTGPYPELEPVHLAADHLTKSMHQLWPEYEPPEDFLPQWSGLKERTDIP